MTVLNPGEGEKAFHHKNRSRARRNHIYCKCSAIDAKAKMDDNTNANMIYSNLQSKEQIVNRDPIHKWLTDIGISAWLSCSNRVAHLCHQFLLYMGPSISPLIAAAPTPARNLFFLHLLEDLSILMYAYVFCQAALHNYTRGGVTSGASLWLL